ncbi:hypothetical protein Pcinc_019247 [Petrolisthes cinctipes]|uniref:Uncharacterized protein n=1 Tax=Petrolisthes cinctipes TaxID=88211 RepID=A0AAE1KLG8_PETCI|nr:hypothetical protein Pcinc_019247 [Petrolisthes cinctipes]
MVHDLFDYSHCPSPVMSPSQDKASHLHHHLHHHHHQTAIDNSLCPTTCLSTPNLPYPNKQTCTPLPLPEPYARSACHLLRLLPAFLSRLFLLLARRGGCQLTVVWLQDYKEFIDAECLVPAPVTEAPFPIELRPLKTQDGSRGQGGAGHDLASMDSTDTFASCPTHPFNSEADLTEDQPNNKDSNLYVNPLDADGYQPPSSGGAAAAAAAASSPPPPPRTPTPRSSPRHRLHRPQGYTTDSFDDTRSTDNLLGSSRSSLQDSPLPKHRRARFQEVRPFHLPSCHAHLTPTPRPRHPKHRHPARYTLLKN